MKVCIDSGANVSLISAEALPPDTPVTHWKSQDRIETLDRTIQPKLSATIDITVGNTRTTLSNVVVSPLPKPLDIILGSDWRRNANVEVTFHPTNDVTLVNVTKEDKQCPTYAVQDPTSSSKPDHIGETLIASFCHHRENERTDFVRIEGLEIETDPVIREGIETAVSSMTKDATNEERDQLRALLLKNSSVFASKTTPIGLCPHVEHSIELRDNIPVASRPYRCSPTDRNFMKEQVNEYLKKDIIRPSESEYAAPTIVVDQPNHPTTPRRMVHDYRKLNEKTINPTYPMPVMEDVIFDITADKAQYFTVMDVKAAFLTVRVKEDDVHKTAFVTPDGKYEYLRMAFGFCKAPQTMQKIMRHTFDGLPRTATYMDDVGQGARTIQEALELLEEALARIKINGLKMDIRKCQFIRNSISFLGYEISLEGRIPDGSRIAAIDKFEPHVNAKKLYSFLQFANHYRKFIPNFSKITRPLRNLISKQAEFQWTSEHESIVENLKSTLKSPPILSTFRPECQTRVHVDACQTGLGAILTQLQDGKERVIEYASKSLNEHDSKLHSNLLECMALHWALTEKFALYLRGGPRFTVFTDNFSLTYLMKKGAINRRFARWMLDLADYTFDVLHRPGRLNTAADALSRQTKTETMSGDIPETEGARGYVLQSVITGNHETLRKFQALDADCRRFTEDSQRRDSAFKMDDGILTKEIVNKGRSSKKIIVPGALRDTVMKIFHDGNGHLGATKTKDLIERKYWWPSMSKDVKTYVQSCHTCQTINARTKRSQGCLHPREIPNDPNTVISLDHLGPINDSEDEGYVLVCIDHATRYMDAIAVPSTASTYYIDYLLNRWIPRFGVPEVIITDQARGFVNKKTASLHRRLGIEHVNTPPYWPQANGLVERMVATLKQVLRKLLNEKRDWDRMLAEAVFAINVAKTQQSGYSAFWLMHGYQPRLPGELNIGSVRNYIEDSVRLHELAMARKEAKENLQKSQAYSTRRYDARRDPPAFNVGDKVLCSIGARKWTLDPRYDGPYEITDLAGENLVRIKRIGNPGCLRDKTVNVEQLRPYYERINYPTELADSSIGRQLGEGPGDRSF